MVDALRAAHRAVKRGGFVIDARPDAARPPRLVAGGRVRGRLEQTAETNADDAAADRAVERVLAEGLFRRARAGCLWFRTTYRDLAELDAYLVESARFSRYPPATRRALLPFRKGPIHARRALKFDVLERL